MSREQDDRETRAAPISGNCGGMLQRLAVSGTANQRRSRNLVRDGKLGHYQVQSIFFVDSDPG